MPEQHPIPQQSRGTTRRHQPASSCVSTQEISLRIILDEDFIFPPLMGNTQRNITDWAHHDIPPVEMTAENATIRIEFAVYRDGDIIGQGGNVINRGEMRKGTQPSSQTPSTPTIEWAGLPANSSTNSTGRGRAKVAHM